MKLLTTFLMAAAIGLLVYTVRRRVWFALRVGAIAYFVLLFGRLVFSAGDLAERADEIVWPALILLVVWASLWWGSRLYAERQAERRRQAVPRASSGTPPR